MAEAQVQQAQTALEGARIAPEKTALVTPLASTVGAVVVEQGEAVMAGTPPTSTQSRVSDGTS